MRLFIAIELEKNIKSALMEIQGTMKNVPHKTMTVKKISLYRSDRGKHGIIYTELE